MTANKKALRHLNLHDRSGRVALPRAKVKPAAPALKEAEAPERRATRAVLAKRATIVIISSYGWEGKVEWISIATR